MSDLAPWLAVAGLGAFHGANPAMGWLFAVALGLHRQSRRVVWLSLLPIAAGHGLSVAVVLALVVILGLIVDQRALEVGAGLLLLAWAGYHVLFGHKGRVRFGMRTGMVGLGVWSFLMATSHGAGLMLLPVVLSLCLAATPARELTASGSLPIALAALGVHTGGDARRHGGDRSCGLSSSGSRFPAPRLDQSRSPLDAGPGDHRADPHSLAVVQASAAARRRRHSPTSGQTSSTMAIKRKVNDSGRVNIGSIEPPVIISPVRSLASISGARTKPMTNGPSG